MEAVKLNREITEEFEDFCKGCNKDDLCIRYKLLFAENRVAERITLLTCENLDKCTRLYQYLKERQNG